VGFDSIVEVDEPQQADLSLLAIRERLLSVLYIHQRSYDPLSLADASGNGTAPSFVAVAGTGNPLAGFDVGSSAKPTFTDIDGDGDIDAFVGEGYGTVNVTVNSNNPPAPAAPAITTNEDTSATSQVAHNDPDVGDTHTYNVTTTPANGTASVTATGISLFVPNANFNGTNSFGVTVTDATGATGTVTINVVVNAVNNAPAPTAPAITTNKATPATSQVLPNDPDVGDTHTYAVTTGAANGTATVDAAGLATYTPNTGFAGNDSFTVTVTDSAGATGTVTINVTVNVPAVSTAVASIPPTNADVYVALQLPDGTLLVMQPDGSFSTTMTALASNIPVPDFNGPIFNYTFTGAEPVGSYPWFAALTMPGTLNVIGTLAVAPLSFGP